MKIGYIRVSTQDQNTIRQEVLMKQLGVDQVYIDKFSGKNRNRPELQTMLEFVRKGDVVIVESISRFARNTKDLLELVEQDMNYRVTTNLQNKIGVLTQGAGWGYEPESIGNIHNDMFGVVSDVMHAHLNEDDENE